MNTDPRNLPPFFMAAFLALHLPPATFNGFPRSPRTRSTHFTPFKNPDSPCKYPISSAFSSNSNWEKEEQRWIREEQRWIREEQRWMREESKWKSEREALLLEISDLKLQIQALKNEKLSQEASISDLISNLNSLLKNLKEMELKPASRVADQNQILERVSGSNVLFEEGIGVAEAEEVKGMIFEEIRVPDKRRKTLKKGSEGEDVRAMQEALQRLGFYSGEEDMEYSSFSSGTVHAVKTWQATLGILEDGIMTEELLEKLFMRQEMMETGLQVNPDKKGSSGSMIGEDGVNGVAHVAEVAEIQQTVVNETSVTEVEVSEHRVFLLGENRWEEPSRLAGRDNQLSGTKARAATKCLNCRGEGRLLCTECDGTGEPNIEPQFLEWVDEGAKCPYCEGLGYTICDICEGKALI